MSTPTCTAADCGIKVFLVEDSVVIRERLMSMLGDIAGVTVLGHADNAHDAIDQILRTSPEVVVLDLRLAGSSGIVVLRTIKQRAPHIAVIVLTNFATPQYRNVCSRAGADFFLDKTEEFQKIPSILEQLKTR